MINKNVLVKPSAIYIAMIVVGIFFIASFVIIFPVNIQAETIIHDHRTKKSSTIPTPRKAPQATVAAKYLGQHPSDRQNGWSDGLQGVGHDQNNWFFTQKNLLWKFPVTHDLNKSVNLYYPSTFPTSVQKKLPLPAGVKTIALPEPLKRGGYDYFGDLVNHKGYLFIPLEAEKGKNNQKPLLVVYRASTLAYVGSARLDKQTKAGWVAINSGNDWLYTSNNNLSSDNKLIAYRIDYNALNNNQVFISYQKMKTLYDEHGNIITMKRYMQGGEFSDNGKYLFLVNGRASSDTPSRDGGIWIFDFKTGKKVLKSSGQGAFKYEYHPGFPNGEEPEGITYWGLDKRNAPKIKGNLHVILLNNDATGSDEFWLKHYRVDHK